MIGKIIKGSTFSGAVRYVLDDGDKNNKVVTVLDCRGLRLDPGINLSHKDSLEEGRIVSDGFSIYWQSEEERQFLADELFVEEDTRQSVAVQEIIEDFEMQASCNLKVEKPVRHFILSYSPDDSGVLTNSRMAADARRYLDEMGYGHTQYIVVRHAETDNPHVHIIANAVDDNFKKVPDKYDIKGNIRICQEITLDNGYTWGKHKSMSEAQDIHNPTDEVKYDLSRKIVTAIEQCTSIAFLPEKLAQMGVGCQVKNDDKGLPVGISFSVQAEDRKGQLREYRFAGSHIDRKFSARNIAVACELHEHMPKLIRCAYQMQEDCKNYPRLLSSGAQQEYDNLREVLSRECRLRKRLEYQFRSSKIKGIAGVAFALTIGQPMAVVVPAMYLALSQYKFDHDYAEASRSIDVTLRQVRASKKVMNLILSNDIGCRYSLIRQPESENTSSQHKRTRSRGMRM